MTHTELMDAAARVVSLIPTLMILHIFTATGFVAWLNAKGKKANGLAVTVLGASAILVFWMYYIVIKI